MSHLPTSVPQSITKADLNRLMGYHDWQFVDLAYQLILGRQADDSGLAHNLQALRSGESRREVAFRIASSEEAREKGFNLRLFDDYRKWRRIERIPVIGGILLLFLCIRRIRFIVQEFRRIQNAAHSGLAQGSVQANR